MHIKKFHVKNFKAFADVTLHLNEGVNIFTGVNNAGKTTVLEALSLWHECFSKLIQEAGRSTKTYKKGDYVLGSTQLRYVQFDQINSVRSTHFADIFHLRDTENSITLSAKLHDEGTEIDISFTIKASGQNYSIQLDGFSSYDFTVFNQFFREFPQPIGFYYASSIASISQIERFSTLPQIREAVVKRASASVLRSRLFMLYNYSKDTNLFDDFLNNLSYLLYNHKKDIKLTLVSDLQRDPTVVFLSETNSKDVPKDILLLGSGTLQVIEILLNFYQTDPDRKDFTMVLLDEPDSHIHRDVQARLMGSLTHFGLKNQIFMTTHNESLIRKAELSQLFHLEEKPIGDYQNLGNQSLIKQGSRFSGVFPSVLKPLISSLSGDTTGLDFINAIEADVIIFTEGEEDARMIDILLRQQINNRKKYAYWVMGGISEVFERIEHYKTVFSAIKNKKTLWEKAVLVIDRDFLNDEHQSNLPDFFEKNLNLKTHLWSAYTIESTLMIDLSKCAQLLTKWVKAYDKSLNPDFLLIEKNLIASYTAMQSELKQRFDNTKLENILYEYRNIRDKTNKLDNNQQRLIKEDDVRLGTLVRDHITNSLSKAELYKLMTKKDVEKLIQEAINTYPISFKIEQDFISLIAQIDKSNWQSAWNFLNTI